MRFYEIDAEVRKCLEEIEAADGVESDEIKARLEELDAAEEAKNEGILIGIKEMEAEAAAMRMEEKAVADRRRSLENKVAGLKNVIRMRLDGKKFKTPRVQVTYRKTTSCEIVDELAIPDEYVDMTYSVNKQRLTKALKEGAEIEGARLVEGQSMIIR